ncbi:T9SS type B sorting domain-containing protein [Pedobacter insulae]|uniref:Gliding motility-associated C-terminal domain-containing protein n=1 Tax=Pedobacter insulae TaxID=414048 RepID=A0A1I2UQ21_9SPHI|nr:gliding motility-associated C-terminal domain-containing protein [Pedobacter insulae]SFG76891.1 gliding motility-associated C-terminal domain-containing protein [Pedobacter insulae]
MKNFFWFVLILLFTGFAENAWAQNISNEGTDFWTVFPTHDPSSTLATMNVNITSSADSYVTVSCGTYSESRAIPKNQVVTFLVDRSQSYIDYTEGNMRLPNRGIHIVVAPGMPKVVAFSHVFAANRSAATLILPIESLGQKYFSMNYTQSGNSAIGQNYLTIVAVEDDTHLILHKKDGSKLAIELQKAGDVYEYLSSSKEDFTGTFVEVNQNLSSCKRFAAFSGATTMVISCGNSSDPLLQQLYSVNSWGKSYGIVPFKSRRHIFRVVAQEDNTVVKLDGNVITVLNKGMFYEHPTLSDAGIVSADKLISVAQYSLTEACSAIGGGSLRGDPEMVLLNPIEFNIKDITVFSSDANRILEKYVNVFMKTSKTSTFKLNGTPPSAGWTVMASDPTYSYIQIQVYEESLTLTADDGFNAIAYGFGQTESYAYSAGTNLYSTSTLNLVNLQSGLKSLSSACLGQQTNPTLTVPYRLSKITWNFDDGTRFEDSNLGVPVESVDNIGVKLYTYTSPVRKVFTEEGTHIVSAKAIVLKEDLPPCVTGNELTFNFEIEVVPLGVANFEYPDICAGTPIQFLDKSNITGNIIAEWKWEFDGVIKTAQNPTHTFTKGMHTVKLSVANASGCWSDVFVKNIEVTKDFPQLEFLKPNPVCINDSPSQLVVNEKMGLTASTKIFKGKGTSVTGLFNPTIAGVGIHEITYVFSSNAGCTDSITQSIEVYAKTLIDAPRTVYILAGGERVIPARIKNVNSAYHYKYKWTPATGLSNPAILNPIAFPDQDTEYTLTVSIDGFCDVSEKVLVKVLEQVKPPNTFSPNGDGTNDVWNILSLDSYPNAEISVFNRNGQKVFSSIGYAKPFDGNFRGSPLPVGVYYYIINPKNGRKTITGPLTIIR